MSPVPAQDVRDGDKITAQFKVEDDFFTITGTVHARPGGGDLVLASWVVAHANGNPGPALFCVVDRTPLEPPVGTILEDSDGDYWAHVPDGWVCIVDRYDRTHWSTIANDYDLKEVTT